MWESSQSVVQKNRSRSTNVGVWPFDHVYLRPFRYSSLSARSLRRRRNLAIIRRFRLSLLLSSSRYMRLKSPHSNQGPGHSARTSRGSRKNAILSASLCGP
jgi:hypothetical protein